MGNTINRSTRSRKMIERHGAGEGTCRDCARLQFEAHALLGMPYCEAYSGGSWFGWDADWPACGKREEPEVCKTEVTT